jgi:hypothetical protein
MQALVELSRDGGYVCARYRNHKHLLIGKVPPNSKIKLVYGRWQDRRYPKLQGRKAIMKTLQLTNVQTVSEFDNPTILVGQPQQGTIAHWRRVGNLIRELVERIPIQIGLKRLDDAQQEMMCSEFLRSVHSGLPTLIHLLLPVGRTMKTVDILGLATDSRRIFAQVTLSDFKAGGPKFQSLLPLIKEGHVVFFCQHTRQEIVDGVTVVPIESVFQEFTSTPTGKQWMKHACGIVMAAFASATSQ